MLRFVIMGNAFVGRGVVKKDCVVIHLGNALLSKLPFL